MGDTTVTVHRNRGQINVVVEAPQDTKVLRSELVKDHNHDNR